MSFIYDFFTRISFYRKLIILIFLACMFIVTSCDLTVKVFNFIDLDEEITEVEVDIM